MDLQAVVWLVGGLILLVIGAEWLVRGAAALAATFGVTPLVIGLTVVAYGTSMPELAVSVQAGWLGHGDLAIANVVGSNIFNILLVLGSTGIVAPAGIPVPTSALRFDLPVMIAVSVACLPIFFSGHLIERWEGLLFLGYYVAYNAYLVLAATNNSALPVFSGIMAAFVLPLTAVTLAIVGWRSWTAQRGGTDP